MCDKGIIGNRLSVERRKRRENSSSDADAFRHIGDGRRNTRNVTCACGVDIALKNQLKRSKNRRRGRSLPSVYILWLYIGHVYIGHVYFERAATFFQGEFRGSAYIGGDRVFSGLFRLVFVNRPTGLTTTKNITTQDCSAVPSGVRIKKTKRKKLGIFFNPEIG